MKQTIIAVFAALALFSNTQVNAECQCACVGGQVKAICSNGIEPGLFRNFLCKEYHVDKAHECRAKSARTNPHKRYQSYPKKRLLLAL